MQLEVDLMAYRQINQWTPQLGDMLFRDGIFSRWCGIIEGLNNDKVSVRISGNPRLLVTGEYKTKIMKVPKITNTMAGSYFVISKDGTYYV
jgi:hypothetical protein